MIAVIATIIGWVLVLIGIYGLCRKGYPGTEAEKALYAQASGPGKLLMLLCGAGALLRPHRMSSDQFRSTKSAFWGDIFNIAFLLVIAMGAFGLLAIGALVLEHAFPG